MAGVPSPSWASCSSAGRTLRSGAARRVSWASLAGPECPTGDAKRRPGSVSQPRSRESARDRRHLVTRVGQMAVEPGQRATARASRLSSEGSDGRLDSWVGQDGRRRAGQRASRPAWLACLRMRPGLEAGGAPWLKQPHGVGRSASCAGRRIGSSGAGSTPTTISALAAPGTMTTMQAGGAQQVRRERHARHVRLDVRRCRDAQGQRLRLADRHDRPGTPRGCARRRRRPAARRRRPAGPVVRRGRRRSSSSRSAPPPSSRRGRRRWPPRRGWGAAARPARDGRTPAPAVSSQSRSAAAQFESGCERGTNRSSPCQTWTAAQSTRRARGSERSRSKSAAADEPPVRQRCASPRRRIAARSASTSRSRARAAMASRSRQTMTTGAGWLLLGAGRHVHGRLTRRIMVGCRRR